MLYDQGIGCDKDHDKALDLCRKAAYKVHEKEKNIIKDIKFLKENNIIPTK